MKPFFARIVNKNLGFHFNSWQRAIVLSLLAVHVVLLFFFLSQNVTLMVAVNGASILIYLLALRLALRRQFSLVLKLMYAEIILHQMLASLCLGWGYGFHLYCIALVPAAFYVSYTGDGGYASRIAPLRYSAVSLLAFYLTWLITSLVPPLYDLQNESLVRVVYVCNSLLANLVILLVMILLSGAIVRVETQLRKQNTQLARLSNLDPLTGLNNRRRMRALMEPIREKALREPPLSFCAVICDIDDFKSVNDTYGHQCGDYVLKKVADTLSDVIGEQGHVGRWGGEEFLIVIAGMEAEPIRNMLEQLCCAIQDASLTFNGDSPAVTITIGAAYTSRLNEINTVIGAADRNLYVGKRQGKSCVVMKEI